MGIQSAGYSVSKNLVQIMHSAEEDNLSPCDLKITCLCQSIKINNNKHVYRQSQLRKPYGSGVEWAECSLVIGVGYSSSSSSSKVVYFNCYISGVQRFKGLKPCWAYLPPSFDHNIHIHDDLIIGKTMLVKTKTFNSSALGRIGRLH